MTNECIYLGGILSLLYKIMMNTFVFVSFYKIEIFNALATKVVRLGLKGMYILYRTRICLLIISDW